MKNSLKIACIAAALCCTACPVREYENYGPVYMSRADLLNSVKSAGARELGKIGKLWISGDRIYICERYKGVHIIDNSNPSAPIRADFIEIPGCLDVAVKNGILYADNAADLIAYDLAAKNVTSRKEKAFKRIISPEGRYYTQPTNKDSVIVDFKKKVLVAHY